MIVMPANATGIRVGYIARIYEQAPARLGHLFSPGAQTGPHRFMPYALDNGAFACFKRGVAFDEPVPVKVAKGAPPRKASALDAWRELLAWARDSGQRPLWCLVPDVVGDNAATLRSWERFAPEAAAYGWPLAFASQDGMQPSDVPAEAAVVFMGGAPQRQWRNEWKWNHLTEWARAFPNRLHVGRVNGLAQLRVCAKASVASCDGTGFGMAVRQWNELEAFLAEQAGERPADDQLSVPFDPSGDVTERGSRSVSTGAPALTGGGR